MVGSGRRGLQVCLHVSQLLTHPAQVSRPHGVGGPLIAGIRCGGRVKGRRGHSPGERGPLALREPRGKSPTQAPGPQVFPAHTVCEELGELLGSVAHGESRGPLGGRVGFRFPDRCLGTLCKWSDRSRVGQVTRGRLVVGEPECACAARSRPENSHPRLGEKPCPGGLPMFSQAERGTPLRRENRGIFAVVGSGWRVLPVCLHGRQVPALRTQVFEPRGGRGLLIAGCKCPAGSRNGESTPRPTQGTGPLESSLENPPPKLPVPKSVLSTLSVLGWECCWAVLPRGNRVVL